MAECSLEDDDWETVQRYTVVLSGPKDGFPYSREDFRAPLTAVIGSEVSAHALSFGPCGMNSEWWLTLKDQESRDRLLLAGAIKVRNRYVFRIQSASKLQFVVRVHWAPPFMSNKFIGQMLSKHVKIVSMDKETAVADGFDGMATGIRKIVVEGNVGDVPHKSCVVCPFTGVTHNILLVINGRKSLCLRCNGEGHGRRDCKAQYCHLHKTFGHSYESCVERKLQFAREARHEGVELTAEEERLLEEDTLRHSLTAGQGELVASAGRDTSPAPQTQVIAGACIVVTDTIVCDACDESPVGAATVSTLEADLSLSESAISDTDGEASDADMPLWSVVVGRNSRKRKGVRVPAAFPAGVSSGSSPGDSPGAGNCAGRAALGSARY